MRDYSEKRDFHRMSMDSRILVTDGSGESFSGICKDLSGSGIQIFLDKPVNVGAELHTLLPSASDQFPPFEAIVEVLRCEPSRDGFLVGTAIKQVKH